jgi:hypothetical protein
VDLAVLRSGNAFPFDSLVVDWEAQDTIAGRGYRAAAEDIAAEGARDIPERIEEQLAHLRSTGAGDGSWRDVYLELCALRRGNRMGPYTSHMSDIVFVARKPDARRYFYKNGGGFKGLYRLKVSPSTACTMDTVGVGGLRDVKEIDVSYEGDKLLFTHRNGISEMDLNSGNIRELTSGFIDRSCLYLPDGNILFSSTRCHIVVPCNGGPVVNWYLCDGDGGLVRRIGFDQAHDFFPSVLPDGRVLYTRWGYNDRTRWTTFDLFTMNPDGTRQLGYYGNASCFPQFIACARPVAETRKVLAVLTGKNNGSISGPMAVLDVSVGDEGTAGLSFFGEKGEVETYCGGEYNPKITMEYTHPYPFDETACMVSGRRRKIQRHFSLYFVTADGARELLATHPEQSCIMALPIVPRARPPIPVGAVEYSRKTADCSILDVYSGRGLPGVPRGTIKSMRVVALDYRVKDIGQTDAPGTGFHPPASLMGGAWDVKVVLGETPVHEDGSVACIVPARVPLYFQLLDENRHVVQSMREWTTFMPGEKASCTGCHETKYEAPPTTRPTATVPAPLEPFYGPPRGFSFTREIQPILDKHCVSCHNGNAYEGKLIDDLTADSVLIGPIWWSKSYMSLVEYGKDPSCNTSERTKTSGTCERGTLSFDSTDLVVFYGYDDDPAVLPPYYAGAARSRLISMLAKGHHDVIVAKEEMDKLACWVDLAVPYVGDWIEHLTHEAAENLRQEREKGDAWLAREQENLLRLAANHLPNQTHGRRRHTAPSGSPPTYLNGRLHLHDARGSIVEVYSLDGRRVESVQATRDNRIVVSLLQRPSSVLIVRVVSTGDGGRRTESMVHVRP